MNKKEHMTKRAEETFALGKEIGKAAKAGDIYALYGDLGAGKTVLAKGIAKGLGIEDVVSSPTFTIVREYDGGRLKLYHFDVYRIGDISEMEDVGYEETFYGDGVCVIEWAELIEDLLPQNTVRIRMEQAPDESLDARRITITGPNGETGYE